MDKPENFHLYSQILEFKPRKSDLRRMSILNAVIDGIAEEGVHQLSAERISKRTKMRRSHIVYYFPNLDAMIEAAIKFVVSTGQEITVSWVASATTPEAQLQAMVGASFAWFERYPKHSAVMTLFHYLATSIPVYKALSLKVQKAGEDRLEGILLAGSKKRKPGNESRRLSRLMRSLLLGSLTQLFIGDPVKNYEEEKQAIEDTILKLAREFWKAKPLS